MPTLSRPVFLLSERPSPMNQYVNLKHTLIMTINEAGERHPLRFGPKKRHTACTLHTSDGPRVRKPACS